MTSGCRTGGCATAYGGDFGDEPNDGTFVLDGVTFPDRAPKPGLWEFRHLASPVRVVSGAEEALQGRVVLENRGDFRDTAWLRAEWEVTADGRAVAAGPLPLPPIPAGERTEVAIPAFQLPPAQAGERWLTLRFLTAEKSGWAPAGFEIGWAQVPLDVGPAGARAAEPDSEHTTWTGDVAIDDEGGLLHPAFAAPPVLSLWRAPTDNDRIGGMAERWMGWGLPSLRRTLAGIERRPDAVIVRASWTTATGIAIGHVQRISGGPDGRLRVEETVEVPAVLADLPRVGTVLELVPGLEALELFGRGPHETYPDRKRGGRFGRWTSTVTEQLVPYVRPQENGGHAEVSWLELRRDDGSGIRIALDHPRQVSVLHQRAEDLDAALHVTELRPRAETIITLDAVHRGVGTASCGPDTLAAYLVRPGMHRWTWTLQPPETPRA